MDARSFYQSREFSSSTKTFVYVFMFNLQLNMFIRNLLVNTGGSGGLMEDDIYSYVYPFFVGGYTGLR